MAVDDDTNVNDQDINQCHEEDNNSHASLGADNGDRFEEFSAFLFQGLSITSKIKSWPGSEHWKYWRPNGSEDAPANLCRQTSKKPYKNHTEVDLVFTTSIDKEFPDIFSPPKSLKSLLLPANRVLRHRLPEDCHYPPDDLIKLFLRPNVLLLGKRNCHLTDDNLWEQRNNSDETLPSWHNESVASDQYDDGCADYSVEDLDTLISQPRQVTRLEVQYDRISKRIDLHALKKALWDQMQEFVKGPDLGLKDTISFRYILSTFSVNCRATKPAILEHISPHLCFICLLHLANEHGLAIHDFPSLDDLNIHLPCLNSSDEVIHS